MSRLRERYGETADFLHRAFGGRLGIAIFLASLAFVCLYWRVGIFINDNYTIANTVVGVANGHLSVDRILYGPPSGATPGMHRVGDELYGRNYGHVVFALPFLWVLQAFAAVAELRIALAGIWSLLVLSLSIQVGKLLDRSRAFAVGGSLLALGIFLANVAVAEPLADRWLALLALQASTMVAAALCGVVVYRLCARVADHRVAAAAGFGLVLATPFGFWAAVPKRHVVTGLLAALVLYSFYRARADADLRFRALSYVWVGLAAWVHAAEALVLFVALLVVDLPTAPSNDRRTLGAVLGAFVLSLVPFLLTNLLIAGNPVEPPRMLPNYGGGDLLSDQGSDQGLGGGEGGLGGGGGGGGGSSGGGGSLLPLWAFALLDSTLRKVDYLVSLFTRSARAGSREPERLYHTFVRSGYIAGVTERNAQQAITMSLLESMPLLGALAALPLGVRTSGLSALREDPGRATAVLAGVQVVGYTLLFLSNLPVHATVTVRYLMPIVPALIYLLVRLAPVREAIGKGTRTLGWSYAVTVLLGGQLLLAFVVGTGAGRGEAVQLHALLGLAVAIPLAVWAVRATWSAERHPRVGAGLLGLAGGLTTNFLLVSGWLYFAYMGPFALPVVGRFAAALAVA